MDEESCLRVVAITFQACDQGAQCLRAELEELASKLVGEGLIKGPKVSYCVNPASSDREVITSEDYYP